MNWRICINGKELNKLNPSVDDFAALLEESMSKINLSEGTVIKGKVTAVENDFVIVDVGLKTEGRIPTREFKSASGPSILRSVMMLMFTLTELRI